MRERSPMNLRGRIKILEQKLDAVGALCRCKGVHPICGTYYDDQPPPTVTTKRCDLCGRPRRTLLIHVVHDSEPLCGGAIDPVRGNRLRGEKGTQRGPEISGEISGQ